jgi:DNA-binding NarL/FixJ family response regulator
MSQQSLAIILAPCYYKTMPKETQTKLSPIEKATRNTIVVYLKRAGFSVTSIANIMGMSVSTVSRLVDKNVEEIDLARLLLRLGE